MTDEPVSPVSAEETPVPAAHAPSRAHALGWAALLLMVFLVPLATSNFTFLPGVRLPLTLDVWDVVRSFVIRACLVVALVGWGWDAVTRSARIRSHPVLWAVAAFLAWSLVSTVFAVHVPTAFLGRYRQEGWITYVFYALALFLGLQYADSPRRMRAVADALLASASIVAGYGFLQSLGVEPLYWGRDLGFNATRAFATYGNPDLLAGFLMFPLPLSLSLALGHAEGSRKALYWLGFALQALALLVSLVRGAWAAGLVAIAIVALAAFRRRWRPDAVDLSFAAAGALGIGVVAWRKGGTLLERITSLAGLGGSVGTRLQIWQAAVSAIRERPLLGSGPDTFSLVFLQHKPVRYMLDAGSLAHADNAHDLPLQTAATVGVPGAVAMFAVFGWALAGSARAAFSSDSGLGRWVMTGMWAGVLAYLVHLLSGVSELGSTLYLWLFAGVLVSPAARHIGLPSAVAAKAALAAVAVAGAVAVGWSGVALVADHHALQSQAFPDTPSRLAAAERAARLQPFNDAYLLNVGLLKQQIFEDALTAYASARQGGGASAGAVAAAYHRAEGAYREAVQAYRAVISADPRFFDPYLLLATVQVEAGRDLGGKAYYEDALATVAEGLRTDPHAPALRVRQADALVGLGQDAKAIDVLEQGLRWDPRYREGLTLLDGLYRERSQLDRAERFYEEMLEILPGDAVFEGRLAALR